MLKTSDFIIEIEQISLEKNITSLDALMLYVEKYKIEPEAIAALVKKNAAFKAKLYDECKVLHLVVKK